MLKRAFAVWRRTPGRAGESPDETGDAGERGPASSGRVGILLLAYFNLDDLTVISGRANVLGVQQHVKLWAGSPAVLNNQVTAVLAGITDGLVPSLQALYVLNLKWPFEL